MLQSLGNLIEKTSQHRPESTNQQSGHSYQSVTKKRASILIRRQSVAANTSETTEEGEKEPYLREIDLQTALQVLQLIEERQHDVNAFVRSASLRVLNTLCIDGFIPLSKYVSVTSVALERLQDKAVLVRKNGMLVCVVDDIHSSYLLPCWRITHMKLNSILFFMKKR